MQNKAFFEEDDDKLCSIDSHALNTTFYQKIAGYVNSIK
jgi:hypothetical protein